MIMEPLYQVTIRCAKCEIDFKTSRVRPSLKKAYKTDSDFCMHYKQNNPDFYVVRVCPECGYASTENFSEPLSDLHKTKIDRMVSDNWNKRSYEGERTIDDALQTYKLALICAQSKAEKDRVTAGVLHHIAWLYRLKGNVAEEKRFLSFALDSYIQVYEKEGVDLNNARLMFLIGELHRRLGNFSEAVRWFSRVVDDKKIMDSSMIRASREMWGLVREEMRAIKAEQEGLSSEGQSS